MKSEREWCIGLEIVAIEHGVMSTIIVVNVIVV